MAFDKIATRQGAYLRIAIAAPSGSGKTYSALLMAALIGKKIGLGDSENGSSKKCVGEPGIPPFFLEIISETRPQEFVNLIDNAATAGVDTLIIDSLSHGWIGALEQVDAMGGSKFNNGWKTVSPIVVKMMRKILTFPGHAICTLRSKSEYVVETVNGKAVPRKLGMAPVIREGAEYDFDVMLEIDVPSADGDPAMSIVKSRCPGIQGTYRRSDIPKIAKILNDWVSAGGPVAPLDAARMKIQFASSADQLVALLSEIGTLSDEDKAAIRPLYAAKKAEIAAAQSPTADDGALE